jgi:hypothetical protein
MGVVVDCVPPQQPSQLQAPREPLYHLYLYDPV